MARLVTKVELAEIFGVSQQTLSNWQKEGMPIKSHATRGQKNQYDTAACIQWWHAWKVAKLTTSDDKGVYILDAERARLAHHQANKTALEERALKERLIDVDIVGDLWAGQVAKMKSAMLALPTKLASIAMAAQSMQEVRETCQQEIENALDELSASTGNTATDREVAASHSDGTETTAAS